VGAEGVEQASNKNKKTDYVFTRYGGEKKLLAEKGERASREIKGVCTKGGLFIRRKAFL